MHEPIWNTIVGGAYELWERRSLLRGGAYCLWEGF